MSAQMVGGGRGWRLLIFRGWLSSFLGILVNKVILLSSLRWGLFINMMLMKVNKMLRRVSYY